MNNPFKNNSLASGLFGFILGIFSVFGGQRLLTPIDGGNSPQINTEETVTKGGSNRNPTILPFHGLSDNPDGDVVITKSGTCYHSPYGCSSLRRSRNIRTVDRIDAENVGVTACSKCNP